MPRTSRPGRLREITTLMEEAFARLHTKQAPFVVPECEGDCPRRLRELISCGSPSAEGQPGHETRCPGRRRFEEGRRPNLLYAEASLLLCARTAAAMPLYVVR